MKIQIPYQKEKAKEAFDKDYRMVDGLCYNSHGKYMEGYLRPRWETGFVDRVQGIKMNGHNVYFKHCDLAAFQKFRDKWLFSKAQIYHIDNNSLNNKEDNLIMESENDVEARYKAGREAGIQKRKETIRLKRERES